MKKHINFFSDFLNLIVFVITISVWFHFQSTLYIYSDANHMKMAERAGVRHVKVSGMQILGHLQKLLIYKNIDRWCSAIISWVDLNLVLGIKNKYILLFALLRKKLDINFVVILAEKTADELSIFAVHHLITKFSFQISTAVRNHRKVSIWVNVWLIQALISIRIKCSWYNLYKNVIFKHVDKLTVKSLLGLCRCPFFILRWPARLLICWRTCRWSWAKLTAARCLFLLVTDWRNFTMDIFALTTPEAIESLFLPRPWKHYRGVLCFYY